MPQLQFRDAFWVSEDCQGVKQVEWEDWLKFPQGS